VAASARYCDGGAGEKVLAFKRPACGCCRSKVPPRRLPARNAGVRVSLVSTILPWLPSTSHAVENRIRCGSSFVAYTLEGASRSPFSHRTYTAGYPNQRRARIHCAREEHARALRECGGRTLWGGSSGHVLARARVVRWMDVKPASAPNIVLYLQPTCTNFTSGGSCRI
jgi:hypothetical protein